MLYFTLLNDLLFSLFYLWQMLYLFALLTARKTIFSFCKCSAKIFFKKSHWNMILLVLSGNMVFFFPKIWSYSLDGKWKMIFLKKYLEIWYFLYIWYRRYFFFLQIWYYLSVKKAKMIFSRKSALKDDISGKIEKDDVHPRKLVFLLIEKLKMIQKFTFIKKFQKFSVLL